MKRSRLLRALLATLAGGALTAPAQVAVWTSNSDQRWSRNANWNGGDRPNTDTEYAVFGTGTQLNPELDAGNYAVGGIVFDAGAASFQLGDDNGARTLKLGGPNATYAFVQQASANDQAVGIATLSVLDPTVLDTPGAGSLTISSAFTGSAYLAKTGTGGTAVLDGNSRNFAGEIYVLAGTLQAGHRNALGNTTGATSVADGGTLAIGGASGFTIGETISLAGNGAGGSGALRNVSGSNTLSGPVVLAADSRIESNAGTLNLSGGLTGTGQTVTFGGAGNIRVSGTIATGSGGVVKDGTGTLRLSAAGGNSFTGPMTINDGQVVAQAENVISNSATLLIATGATLSLGGSAQTVGSLGGDGTLALGGAGTGSLTLTNGSGIFTGAFAGSGTIVIGAGATLTLAADFDAPNLNFTLAGGTLALDGSVSNFGRLDITGDSILDFGSTTASMLTVADLAFQNAGLQLTVRNWLSLSDYFFAQNFAGAVPDQAGSNPQDQVVFDGFSGNDTIWQSFDHQITPAPEPAAYGLLLLSGSLGLLAWRRRHLRRNSSAVDQGCGAR